MFIKHSLFLRVVIPTLLVAGIGALGALAARKYAAAPRDQNERRAVDLVPIDPKSGPSRFRNLGMQPEAAKLARRLGQRFTASQSEVSLLIGDLSIDGQHFPLQNTRSQHAQGENLEIRLTGKPYPLKWSASEGPKTNSARAAGSERALVERLLLDSADEFVLAQLRGASYQTIAKNVRPDDAGDSYDGSLWTVVRVDSPERDNHKKPESLWRLYYINSRTGMIDKIVSEVAGERVEANLNGWTTNSSEVIPSVISWTKAGQQIMELKVNSFIRPTAR